MSAPSGLCSRLEVSVICRWLLKKPSRAPCASKLPIEEIVTQGHSVIVLGVFGGKHQCDSFMRLQQRSQLLEIVFCILLLELFQVTLPELRPFIRIVPEPLPQVGGRRQTFQPVGYISFFFGNPRGQMRSTRTRGPSERAGAS